MTAFVWNCRGVGQPSAVRILRNFVVSHRPSIIFLSEVKSTNIDFVNRIMLSLGFKNLEFIPATGRSGGLLLGWIDCIDITVLLTNDNYINCLVLDRTDNQHWQLTTIYAPPTPVGRIVFWDAIKTIGQSFIGPWCVIGDFNMVLDANDKQGGRPVASSSRLNLRQLTDDMGLIDLGFIGKRFTWNNRRCGNANIQERIDMGFANEAWRLRFPHATITHLVAIKSDHCPFCCNWPPRFNIYLNLSDSKVCGRCIMRLLLLSRKHGTGIFLLPQN